jgi:hypothetical protein
MQQIYLTLRTEDGGVTTVRFCAVMNRMSNDYAIVDFVDNNSRKIFGQLREEGEGKDSMITEKVNSIINGVKELYGRAQVSEKAKGFQFPRISTMVPSIESYVASMTKDQRAK